MNVGDYSAKGKRESNEDKHVVALSLASEPTTSYLAVFDGHGGAGASKYCARNLLKILERQKTFKSDKALALTKAYLKTDAKYLEKYEDDGTTAVVALVDHAAHRIYVANVGDSRCYVTDKEGKCVALTTDHKPNDPEEKARIEKAGHDVSRDTVLEHGQRVHTYRVDGIIAVARSIGDANFKDSFDLKAHEQALTCVPSIVQADLHSSSYIILACDGLWDVCNAEEVFALVKQWHEAEGVALTDCAKRLTALAIDERGSDDNVSIVLAKMKQ